MLLDNAEMLDRKLTEDPMESENHSRAWLNVAATHPEIAKDIAAAQADAIRYIRSSASKAGSAPHRPLKVDRDLLLKTAAEDYEKLGLRQALTRIYVRSETSDQRSRAMEALAKRLELDDREAATGLYRFAYDLDPSPKTALKFAANMFKNGDVSNASALLKLAADTKSSSSVIAKLRLAETLQLGPAIPQRNVADGEAQTGVAYVAAGTLPFLSTGYAVRTHQMLRALDQQGVSAICYARPGFPFDRPDAFDIKVLEPGESRVEGVSYVFSEAAPLLEEPASYIARLSSTLEEGFRSSRPGIVQAASNYMNALPALIAARRSGVPFVYEIRGLWELTGATRLSHWEATDRFRLDRKMEAFVAREADHVLAITQGVADELIAEGVPPANITLLPNAVDPDEFRPRPADRNLAAQLAITGDFTLVYAGSLNAYEGLDDLITAISQLRQQGTIVRLVVVGDGAALRDLQSQVARLSLEGAVTFVGRVPPDQVLRYLSLADAVALPRKAFKLCNVVPPLKPFEAMAMGKPVVLTDLPALREIVRHDVTGLLAKPEDPGDLARTLLQLIVDPDLRARLGEAGRRWVVQERSWSANADLLKNLYASLAQRPMGPGRT